MRLFCRLPALMSVLTLILAADAADWPRFRGPNGSGIAAGDETPPVEWSPTKNLKWKIALPGAGVSCPIVVGDKVFVTCYSGYGMDRRNPGDQEDLKRHLVCLDRKNGTTLWEKSFDPVLPEDPYSGAGVPEHGYASHTPVSDGENVYVFFGKSGAYGFDLEGNQLWHTKLGTESDPRRWGTSSSPIVHDDIVVVPAGPESRAIVGLNKRTGEEVWKAEAEGLGNVWGTPIVTEADGGGADIVIGAPYEIWGLNPETGKLRWYSEVMETDSFSSSVVYNDGLVVAVEGRSGGSVALKPGGKGDITKEGRLWLGRDRGRFGTPVLHDGKMYFVSSKVVNCLDVKSGDRVYQARLRSEGGDAEEQRESEGDRGGRGFGGRGFGGRGGGSDYASLVMGGENLYYVARNGEMFVFKAGNEFEQLAVNRVTGEDEDFSATPAISNGELFIRSDKHIYCVSEKE